jgi:MFS transporter, DHA1 family, multidrug resistance protein
MTIYIAVVYAIMYLSFYAVPHIFRHDRAWTPVHATLPFLSMLIGIVFTCFLVWWYSAVYYTPRLRARGYVLPEDRLPPIMLGSILMPAGLFWLAWSGDVHWICQVIALAVVGSGIMLIFATGVAFIIDIYLDLSASALAANAIVRSAAAAGLPLAAPSMYNALGTKWATSILAFACVALIPAPWVFYWYGERLRKGSKFAPSPGAQRKSR